MTWLARVVATATPVVIAGASLALLFNPWWVLPAQHRAGVAAITGLPDSEVSRITSEILVDVTVGPPDFAVALNGDPLLDDAERAHMRDVFGVLRAFGALVVIAALTLAVTGVRSRGAGWWWRGVGRGSLVAASAGIGVGLVFGLFFDAAWLAFHEVFFPAGNFEFDPRAERLTQLFPTPFWTDAATTVFALAVTLAAGTWLVSRRLARRATTRGRSPARSARVARA